MKIASPYIPCPYPYPCPSPKTSLDVRSPLVRDRARARRRKRRREHFIQSFAQVDPAAQVRHNGGFANVRRSNLDVARRYLTPGRWWLNRVAPGHGPGCG